MVTFDHLTGLNNNSMSMIYEHIKTKRLYQWAFQCHYLISIMFILLDWWETGVENKQAKKMGCGWEDLLHCCGWLVHSICEIRTVQYRWIRAGGVVALLLYKQKRDKMLPQSVWKSIICFGWLDIFNWLLIYKKKKHFV